MENELRVLLSAAEERLARMEKRQRTTQYLLLALAAVLVLGIVLAGTLLLPALHRYDTALDSLQAVGAAFEETDPGAMAALLEKLAALDLSGLEELDAEALADITDRLSQLDPAALQAALEKLQQVNVDRLNGALAQMENVLADLDGLDAEALNTAISNLNKTLGPLLALFDR